MQDSEHTSATAPDDANRNGRGNPSRWGVRALPLGQALRLFTRTGGFYARAWAAYLDRQPDELPGARPTLALAAQVFSDEVVLMGFHLVRSAPHPTRMGRLPREGTPAPPF